jgi:hypothetical protein
VRQRRQSAGDVRIDLEQALVGPAGATAVAIPVRRHARGRGWWPQPPRLIAVALSIPAVPISARDAVIHARREMWSD